MLAFASALLLASVACEDASLSRGGDPNACDGDVMCREAGPCVGPSCGEADAGVTSLDVDTGLADSETRAADREVPSEDAAPCPADEWTSPSQALSLTNDSTVAYVLPLATWNGSHYGMLWNSYGWPAQPASSQSRFALVDRDGAPQPQSAVTLAPSWIVGVPAYSGREFGLVIQDLGSTSFLRLDAAGHPIASSRLLLAPTSVPGTGVAWDPVNQVWGVAWSEPIPGSVYTSVWFAKIDAAGTLVADSKVRVSANGGLGYPQATPLVWAGDRFALAWYVGGVFVSEIGDSVRTSSIANDASGSPVAPNLVWDGAQTYGVAWSIGCGSCGARFARMRVGGGLIAGSHLELGGGNGSYASSPRLGTNGQEFVGVFSVQDGSEYKLMHARIASATGATRGAEPLRAERTPWRSEAQVVWNGCHYGTFFSYGGRVEAINGAPPQIYFIRFR